MIIELLREQERVVNPNCQIIVRPHQFHPKQHELIDAIKNPKYKLVFCQGAQRAGKSTGVFQGLHELGLLHNKPLKFLLLAGKGGQNAKEGGAKRILADVIRDEFLQENNFKLLDLKNKTNGAVQWFSGHELIAADLTVSTIKGSDYDITWIDELDVAVKQGQDKREAVVAAVNTMLAVPHFKLVLTANLDKGIYLMLTERIMELNRDNDCVKIINMTRDDCPHLLRQEVAENYKIAQAFNETLVDPAFAKMRLAGVMSSEGDIFSAITMRQLMEEYYLFTAEFTHDVDEWTVLSIDPSLTGHPLGWMLTGYKHHTLYEIESGEFRYGDGSNDTWTLDRIKQWLLDTHRIYHFKALVIESNTLGPEIAMFARAHGIVVIEQNFGGKDTDTARESMISVVCAVLSDHAFLFKNKQLFAEWSIYDPERKMAKFKGDLADAAIHNIFFSMGGLMYLKKNTPQEHSSTYNFIGGYQD